MNVGHRSEHIAVAAIVGLTAASMGVLALVGSGFDRHAVSLSPVSASCAAPNLAGAVVTVTATNMGGPMMTRNGTAMGAMMRLRADQATVPHGTVSFLVVNAGSLNHELVVVPLPDAQVVGTRAVGGDAKIDEASSLGEASNTCGQGSGEGIAPATSSWVTVALPPGRYELVCNLPGHYTAGMYTQLTVT